VISWRQTNYNKVFYLHEITAGLKGGQIIFSDLDWEFETHVNPFKKLSAYNKDLVYYKDGDEDSPQGCANFGLWYARVTPAVQYAFKLIHEQHTYGGEKGEKVLWWDQELFSMVFASALAAKQLLVCADVKGLQVAKDIGRPSAKDIGRPKGKRRRVYEELNGHPFEPFEFWSKSTDKKYGYDVKNAHDHVGGVIVHKKPFEGRLITLPMDSCHA
jgi:hypothetical protein